MAEFKENGGIQNEINMLENAGYIDFPEAAWRLYGFKNILQKPTLILLEFHLPGQQKKFSRRNFAGCK